MNVLEIGNGVFMALCQDVIRLGVLTECPSQGKAVFASARFAVLTSSLETEPGSNRNRSPKCVRMEKVLIRVERFGLIDLCPVGIVVDHLSE